MRIALRTSPSRNALYAEIASRFPGPFVADADSTGAVITNRVTEAVSALSAEKHVLIDIPEELSEEDCRLLEKAADASGAVIVPGHD